MNNSRRVLLTAAEIGMMKRMFFFIGLAMLGTASCAPPNAQRYQYDNGSQTSAYYPVGGDRSSADLQTAARACDGRFGAVEDGSDTPDADKQCMLAQGRRYGYTTRDGTYADPRHPGLAAATL